MPGLTPDAAFHEFFNPVQRAVRCLDSSGRLGFKEVEEKLYIVSPGGGVPFAKGNATFKLFSWFNVRAIPYEDAWRVTTEQYIHEIHQQIMPGRTSFKRPSSSIGNTGRGNGDTCLMFEER